MHLEKVDKVIQSVFQADGNLDGLSCFSKSS